MRPSLLFVSVFLFVAPIGQLAAQSIQCSGPSVIPKAGLQGPYCHNGRMGFAATEFAPLSEAANIPKARALMFARREAEMKARTAIAKFLNKASISEHEINNNSMIDSSERSLWLNFVSSTSIQSVKGKLAAGVAVIATDQADDMVYVTVATTPDMKDLSSSITNYQPGVSHIEKKNTPSPSGAPPRKFVDPFTVTPSNRAAW